MFVVFANEQTRPHGRVIVWVRTHFRPPGVAPPTLRNAGFFAVRLEVNGGRNQERGLRDTEADRNSDEPRRLLVHKVRNPTHDGAPT